MSDAGTVEKFISCIDKRKNAGCSGVLVSGGCDGGGSVPLSPHMEGIAYAKSSGMKVVAHTGLLSRETALALKSVNVDQVLMDVIGSAETISGVYGLNKTPDDFYQSIMIGKEAGLDVAPHLVVGLDYGRVLGEYAAIDIVSRAEAGKFVLVVLAPKRGTKMQGISSPPLSDVTGVFRYAANTLSNTQITLGCSRPFDYTAELEKTAVDLGFAAISYPCAETHDYAKDMGLEVFFFEQCCSLV